MGASINSARAALVDMIGMLMRQLFSISHTLSSSNIINFLFGFEMSVCGTEELTVDVDCVMSILVDDIVIVRVHNR